jgi:hypothetical protein
LAKAGASGWLKVLLLAVLFSFLNGRICQAQTYTQTLSHVLSWGVLQIPSGSATCSMPTPNSCPCSSNWCAGASTGIPLYDGPESTNDGCFDLKCTGSGCGGNISIAVNASPGGCAGVTGVGSLSFYDVSLAQSFTLPATVVAPAANATKEFCIGATASYNSSVTSGGVLCSPTISVNVASSALIFNQPADIGFDAALALTKNSDINFGTVTANNASTYKISTAGVLSIVSGTGVQLYGTTSAGNITIVGSAADGITISTGGYIANNGVTPSAATCAYNGGGASSCNAGINVAAPGAGTTLLVGVKVAANGTQAAGTTAAPSFTVTVAYQ